MNKVKGNNIKLSTLTIYGEISSSIQFWDVASVLSSVWQLCREDGQLQDPSAQVFVVDKGSASVLLQPWMRIVLSMLTGVEDVLRGTEVTVNSPTIQCVILQVDRGMNAMDKSDVVTFLCINVLSGISAIAASCGTKPWNSLNTQKINTLNRANPCDWTITVF